MSTHFTLFLYLDLGLSEKFAGLGFAMVQFGSITGRPAWGIICDRLIGNNKRKTFVLMGFLFFILTSGLNILLKKISSGFVILFSIAFLFGFSGRGWNGLFFSSISEVVKKSQVGSAIGFSLLFVRVGMLLIPPIFGYIADINDSYLSSWRILGIIIFVISLIQYLFYLKKSN
ncbi:MAG: MFS transporter [Eubacteriales bacterium]